jgi:(p)ppGpp synthase/HD superfamily hydrolase
MSELLEHAAVFAASAHEGQVRKYTGEPYVEHCYAVCNNVQTLLKEYNLDAMIAALLHDTVEDTDVQLESIQRLYGDTVAEYVWYLTKPPAFVGNRAQRKTLDCSRLACAPDIVKFIKICDIMHNAISIKKYDPKFWLVFSEEVKQLLDQMNARTVFRKLSTKSVYYFDAFIEKLSN